MRHRDAPVNNCAIADGYRRAAYDEPTMLNRITRNAGGMTQESPVGAAQSAKPRSVWWLQKSGSEFLVAGWHGITFKHPK